MEVPRRQRLADLCQAMPEIITHARGPLNPIVQARLVQLPGSGEPPTVRVRGSRELVHRIVKDCESLEWYNRMIVTRHYEVPSHKVVPIMRSRPHGLESLLDFGFRADRVQVRLLQDVSSSPEPSSDSSVIYRVIELSGPSKGCDAVENELKRRLKALTGLQKTIPLPHWILRRLAELKTKDTVEALGVIVDDCSHGKDEDQELAIRSRMGVNWIISGKDAESLQTAMDHIKTVINEGRPRLIE